VRPCTVISWKELRGIGPFYDQPVPDRDGVFIAALFEKLDSGVLVSKAIALLDLLARFSEGLDTLQKAPRG
jgi:hypothetical protein